MTDLPLDDAGYRDLPPGGDRESGRRWWDAEAADYVAEHGDFLGEADLCWGPEGVRESDLGLLGPLAGRDVLEIGAGAAQGARWAAGQGARVVASDLSAGMLRQAREIDARRHAVTGARPLPLVQADARRLPFADRRFDVVFTSYGAVPFVADATLIHAEVARLLRPGGRWVFSVTHPVRWAFPDDPTEHGLTATRSYFDRRPYVETTTDGSVRYAEHHRTVGQHVREVVGAGLVVTDLVEPEWPQATTATWGGWSPLRGAVLPGTLIVVARAL